MAVSAPNPFTTVIPGRPINTPGSGVAVGISTGLRPAIYPIVAGITVAGTVPATAAKYAQAYTVQSYNANGQVITRVISLSKLQNQDQDFAEQKVSQTDKTSDAKIIADNTYSQDKLTKILQESIKVDYFLCLKSNASPVIEFNTIKTPQLDSSLIYNFYTSDETDIVSQEDPDLDPFINNEPAPRYVSLSWQPVENENELHEYESRTKEEQQLAKMYLQNNRGVTTIANSSIANSFASSKKAVNPVVRDGRPLEIVDTHDLPAAFNAVSNSRIYKNSALTVFNTNAIDIDKINFNDVILSKLNEK